MFNVFFTSHFSYVYGLLYYMFIKCVYTYRKLAKYCYDAQHLGTDKILMVQSYRNSKVYMRLQLWLNHCNKISICIQLENILDHSVSRFK